MVSEITDKLIIALIKDDLINSKLINALNAIGLNADCYFLYLDSTIFKFVGYENDDYAEEIYEKYRDLAMQAKFVDISTSNVGLDSLALELFQFLESNKPIK